MSRNKIAVLILAHHNPEQLRVLINHLKPDFDVFIQIDKKSNLHVTELPSASNVYYFKQFEVYWGHVSQVYSMKFILEQAFKKGYERYCIISGDDLPIKSNVNIKFLLNKNKNNIYMYANPLPIKTWGFNHGFDRLDRYWFLKSNQRNFIKALGRFTLALQRLLPIKIKRFPIKYYAGSNWLNLTHESLEYTFKYLENNPDFLKKMKYSRATDEIWIQSIIMNSPLKKLVINDDLRYIDWITGPEFPRVLCVDDLPNLKTSNAIFARKFNIKDNEELILNFLNDLK